MRREGKVTGYVRRRSDSRAAREEYERKLQDLGFTGSFRPINSHDRIKLSNRATNESKDSSRCRRSGCRGCHACPTSKALAKAKGRNKPRCSWNSRGRNPLAHLDASLSDISAFEEAQIDEYDDDAAADEDDDDKCDAGFSENIDVAVANEHHHAAANQNLFVKCDASYVFGEDTDHHLPGKHGVHCDSAVRKESDISELLEDNCTNDFVVVNGNAAQGHLQSSPPSRKECPPISECLHACDDAISEWYQVAYPSDESDDDDWHLIVD